MSQITRILSEYASSASFADIPEDVVYRAKHLIADFLGSVIRASKESDSTPSVLAMLRRLGLDGPGPSTVFGLDRLFSPASAALLNGVFGHSLDFDDTHAASSLHPSAPVVSAAFAVADMTGASGESLLTAIVIGYEVCCRLGNALDPTEHYARGFHPTATAGVFGAAAAAGRLLGLDSGQMASAFGIAASQAAGSLQFLENGAWNKRYQVGAAAMNGVIAATLASEGFVGAADAIEGRHGFLKGYSGGPKPEMAIEGLGRTFETMKIGVKPYPSCRYTHAAIDGLLIIRAENNLLPAEILAVDIGLHQNGIKLTAAPLAEKQKARSVVEGQFSMPFAAAVALSIGRFGWDDYRLLGDEGIESLASLINVTRDERLEGRVHPFGAHLSVRTKSRVIERLIPDPSGEPETFPDAAAIFSKFEKLSSPVLGGAVSTSLFNLLVRLESLDRVEFPMARKEVA